MRVAPRGWPFSHLCLAISQGNKCVLSEASDKATETVIGEGTRTWIAGQTRSSIPGPLQPSPELSVTGFTGLVSLILFIFLFLICRLEIRGPPSGCERSSVPPHGFGSCLIHMKSASYGRVVRPTSFPLSFFEISRH